ncbi:MAG TPA: DUF2079 domain-containing protein [Pseudonocardiaceae bacterium]|nr:DUF2079 domain-containing protein [Pseudonocardiaceae bacterium]
MLTDLFAKREFGNSGIRRQPAHRAARHPVGRRHPIGVAIISVLAAGLSSAAALLRYYTFRAGTYDLVIFDQAVRSYSQFRLPVAIVKVHDGFGADFSVLGDHFSPILALLAPLYWLYSGPQTLLVAQSVLFAAAIPPLWVLTRRELGLWSAYCVAIAYALAWPLAQAADFGFHEVAFAPVLTAVLLERFSALRHGRGRWWQVVLAAIGLLAVKEDLGLLIAGFGLAVLVLSFRMPAADRLRARLFGAGFVVGGLASVVVVTDVLLPAFGGRPGFYWTYGQFGSSMSGAALDMLTHPLTTVATFFQPDYKVQTMLLLLAMTAFMSLFSPYLLVVLPLLAERMLSGDPLLWGTAFHYNAFLVIPLFGAGVDAVARIGRWARWWSARRQGRSGAGTAGDRIGVLIGGVWASAVLVIGVVTVPYFGFGPPLTLSSWQQNTDTRAASSVIAKVPSGATVSAANYLGPRLSGRDTVLLWDQVTRWTPWVAADVGRAEFPFCTLAAQRKAVSTLETEGYRVVYSDDGYLLLHHPGVLPPLSTAAAPTDC